MIFRFSAPYPYLQTTKKFPIITKQNRYHEKIQNIAKKMVDNSEPAPSQKKKHYMKFDDLWCNKFKFIQKFWQGQGFAFWTVCGSNYSVAHGGENDINRHKNNSKHKGYVDAAQQKRKLTNFGSSPATANQKLVKSELFFFFFSGFLVANNLPFRTAQIHNRL